MMQFGLLVMLPEMSRAQGIATAKQTEILLAITMNRDSRKKQMGKKKPNVLCPPNLAWTHRVLTPHQSRIMYKLKPLFEGLQSDAGLCSFFLPVASADLGLFVSQCLSFPIYTVRGH